MDGLWAPPSNRDQSWTEVVWSAIQWQSSLSPRCELWLPKGAKRFGFAMSPHGFWLQSSGTVQPANIVPGGTLFHNLAGSGPDVPLQETTAWGPQEWSDAVEWVLFNQKHCHHEEFSKSLHCTSPPWILSWPWLHFLRVPSTYFPSLCVQKKEKKKKLSWPYQVFTVG